MFHLSFLNPQCYIPGIMTVMDKSMEKIMELIPFWFLTHPAPPWPSLWPWASPWLITAVHVLCPSWLCSWPWPWPPWPVWPPWPWQSSWEPGSTPSHARKERPENAYSEQLKWSKILNSLILNHSKSSKIIQNPKWLQEFWQTRPAESWHGASSAQISSRWGSMGSGLRSFCPSWFITHNKVYVVYLVYVLFSVCVCVRGFISIDEYICIHK